MKTRKAIENHNDVVEINVCKFYLCCVYRKV